MSLAAEGDFEISNSLGLHARAAAQLVKTANRYKCEVLLESHGEKVNAKSIMGVLMLAAAKGTRVKLLCKGDGAHECLGALAALINDKFGEPD